MAITLSRLASLKLVRLKRVAVATGINSSGTKTDLTTRLLTELQNRHDASSAKPGRAATKEQGHRIVSIDMGIRNLAYCVLAVPSSLNTKTPPKMAPTTPPPPAVEAWTRIAVSGKTSPAPGPEATNAQDQAAPRATATATATATLKATAQAKVKETFDPATYAQHAYALIYSLLHTHHPSTILIERQRYRSMGAAAVQEWTLRVNMFEAMLHAVLETMGREGRWRGEVWAVSPGKVASFWVGDGGGGGRGKAKEDGDGDGDGDGKVGEGAKKRGNKGVKIDVVGGWLVGGGVVRLKGQAEGMGRVFLGRWRGSARKRGRSVEGKGVEGEGADGQEMVEARIGKLDDLADCLLQGVAWVKWQENRRLLVEGGVDSLDGLD